VTESWLGVVVARKADPSGWLGVATESRPELKTVDK